LEGRRNISFSGSLDVDNTSNSEQGTNPVDAMLLQHVLNQGQDLAGTPTDVRDDAVIEGISISVTLERINDGSDVGVNGNGLDKIVFQMPAGGTSTSSTPGLVMRSASMDIAGPPQIHQAMDIDGFASSISIDLYDNVAPS